MNIEELKIVASSIFSDAISIRNPDREDFLKKFIEENKKLINSKSPYYVSS